MMIMSGIQSYSMYFNAIQSYSVLIQCYIRCNSMLPPESVRVFCRNVSYEPNEVQATMAWPQESQ